MIAAIPPFAGARNDGGSNHVEVDVGQTLCKITFRIHGGRMIATLATGTASHLAPVVLLSNTTGHQLHGFERFHPGPGLRPIDECNLLPVPD